jgi:outer membrane protein
MPRSWLIGFFCWLFPIIVFATDDLMTVYRQALEADPTLAQSRSETLSEQENIAISRAGLLPEISLSGTATATNQRVGNPNNNGTVAQYNLSLKQQIFNFGKWITFQESKLSVKAAQANYAATLQDLIVRMVTAYFNQTEAYASWQLSRNNHKDLAEKLRETQLRYTAGLSKEADVANAKAAYDTSTTDVVMNFNRWLDARSELQAITGVNYEQLATLKNSFPLAVPQPNNLQQWLTVAQHQNLNLLSARFNADAAREKIRLENAGNYPTIDASLGFAGNRSQNNGLKTTNSAAAVGSLDLNLPIYEGGLVTADTRQAQYDYQAALAKYTFTYRATVSQTQQGYNDVLADIAKIQSGGLAVESNRQSLKDTDIAYQGGIRSMFDLLTAQQNLYQTELIYLQAKYNYFEAMIKLKEAAGTLNVDDVRAINQWLH